MSVARSRPDVAVIASGDVLGEGPLWDDRRAALWWVDVKRQRVSCAPTNGSDIESWELQAQPGCLVLTEHADGAAGPLVALPSGLVQLHAGTGVTTPIGAPRPSDGHPRNRCNDGRVDRWGRLWVGTMDDDEVERTGALYCVDPDGTWTYQFGDVGVPNATCFSPDGRTMYWADSWDGTIWAFAVDGDGRVGERQVFAVIEGGGGPDGATVDADGHVWCALWDGWRVVRFRPDGTLEREVEVPVQRPTCPAFGGPDLGILYLTTASLRLTADELAVQPLAGSVLAIDARAFGVHGLAEHRMPLPSRWRSAGGTA